MMHLGASKEVSAKSTGDIKRIFSLYSEHSYYAQRNQDAAHQRARRFHFTAIHHL